VAFEAALNCHIARLILRMQLQRTAHGAASLSRLLKKLASFCSVVGKQYLRQNGSRHTMASWHKKSDMPTCISCLTFFLPQKKKERKKEKITDFGAHFKPASPGPTGNKLKSYPSYSFIPMHRGRCVVKVGRKVF
jgi:hypothetical protein